LSPRCEGARFRVLQISSKGRPSEKEFIRFLGISFASVRELGYLIDLSARLGHIESDELKDAIELQGRTAAALAALINSFD
jgi:four helix bundle protein